MSGLKNSILDTVGNTPIVRINNIAPRHVELYVKLEAFNPLGSVKDRLALGVIEAAERDGSLKPGQTVIEATSGNTGIGLAMVCAQKGYPLVITMAENFSVERRKLMRFLGAKVILTPASEKGTGMIEKARELAAKHGWFMNMHCVTKYVKVAFFNGTSLTPQPPVASKNEGTRYVHLYEGEALDEAQLARWIKQAAKLSGWQGFGPQA